MIEQLTALFATDQPLFLMLAGPDGAGKSTFRRSYGIPADFPFIDPDEVARTRLGRDPKSTDEALGASIEATATVKAQLNEGRSCGLETVFSDSTGQKLGLLRLAKRLGYRVGLIFIGLDDPQLCVARVMDRVEEGGHDVPDELIYKRYPRVFENLKKAIPICDFVLLVDNSGEARHRVFGTVTPEKGFHLWDRTPHWYEQYDIGKR